MIQNSPAVWALIALLFRLVMGSIVHIYSLNAGFEGFVPLSNFGDDIFYWETAKQLSQGIVPEYIPNFYPWALAGIISVFGENIFLGKCLNILISAVTVFLGCQITSEVAKELQLSRRNIKYATNLTGLILTFYPSQIFYSAQLIKDPLLVFFGMMNLYSTVLILKGGNRKMWIIWLLTLVGAFTFRPYTAVALIVSFLIYLLFVWKAKTGKKLTVISLFLVFSAIVPFFLGKGFFALDYVLAWSDVEKVSQIREAGYSVGGSALELEIDYSSPVGFVLTYGLSFFTVMLGPFPWQIRAPIHLTALPEAILSSSLLLYLVFSARRKDSLNRGDTEKLLIVFSIVLIAIVAFFSDNIGANNRLRLLPWNILFIYSAVCLARIRENRQISISESRMKKTMFTS